MSRNKNDREKKLKTDNVKFELRLNHNAPMFVYVQRQEEKPFNLNAQMQQLSAGEIVFKSRARLKKNEIVGVIFKIAKKDIMANIRIVHAKKILSGIKAEYIGVFIGLSYEQEQFIRKYVYFENLRLNRRKKLGSG